jgi:hypothetical protein
MLDDATWATAAVTTPFVTLNRTSHNQVLPDTSIVFGETRDAYALSGDGSVT